MTFPVSVPNLFANQSGGVPAGELDANFAALVAGINNALTEDNTNGPSVPLSWSQPLTLVAPTNLTALTLTPTGTGQGLAINASGSSGNAINLTLASGQPGINIVTAAAQEILALQLRQGTQPFWQLYQVASDTSLSLGVSTLVPPVINFSAANGQVQVYEPNFSKLALANVATTDFATIAVSYAGFTSTVIGNLRWLREGDLITLVWDFVTGTSNGNSFGASGVLPAAIRPGRNVNGSLLAGTNNGSLIYTCFANVTTSGDFGFFSDAGGASWTASGTKAINTGSMTYSLQP